MWNKSLGCQLLKCILFAHAMCSLTNLLDFFHYEFTMFFVTIDSCICMPTKSLTPVSHMKSILS